MTLTFHFQTPHSHQFALNIGGMFMDKDSTMVTVRGKGGQALPGQAMAASENSQVFKTSYTGVLTSKPMSVWLDG
jgi:hypothetical protein